MPLALSVSGCGGHSRHARTGARALSIYTSLPFEGPYAPSAAAIYDAEELALAQAGGVVDGFKVVLRRLDDASSGIGSTPTTVGESARIAAGDQSTIAYIGELTPGSSLGSIAILSPAGILQVSPGDTATGLAGRTFARVVPPDSDEAEAQLTEMAKLGVKRLYLLEDRTTYGHDIAAAAISAAATRKIDVVDAAGKYLRADTHALVQAIKKAKVDALLYAGSPSGLVGTFWNALSAADGTIKKFASAAVTSPSSWAQTNAAARYNTFLSAPGLLPSGGLPRAGSQFETDFAATYGSRVPWASGIFGYVAMSGVLSALHGLDLSPKDFTAVVRAKLTYAFLHTRDLPSALGTYSIVGGQTSFRRYFFTTYNKNGEPSTFTLGPD